MSIQQLPSPRAFGLEALDEPRKDDLILLGRISGLRGQMFSDKLAALVSEHSVFRRIGEDDITPLIVRADTFRHILEYESGNRRKIVNLARRIHRLVTAAFVKCRTTPMFVVSNRPVMQ